MTWMPRRCRSCVEGMVTLKKRPGSEVPIPTCGNCGDELIDHTTVLALDEENRRKKGPAR
jgi:hypothetical protein